MRNRTVILLLLSAALYPMQALSQASTPPPSPPSARQADSTQYYKLTFTLRELDGGKVVNQRTFLMRICTDGSWNSLRTGTRIPVSFGDDKFNYVDVGVSLDVRVMEGTGGEVPVYVKGDISSVSSENTASSPTIRQLQVRTASLLPLGKATTVFSGDDLSSKHLYELDVTPTRDK